MSNYELTVYLGFIFTVMHFSFDINKSVVIESESLLERQFCFGGGALLKSQSVRKKIVGAEN
jgi:hypothetical protein